MTNKSIKKLTHNFINKNRLISVDYSTLERTTESLGYTIIYFNCISNDADVETIIQNLKLHDAISKSRGFTYTDKDYRLVFINENLNDDEKRLVLSHELGHIACEHFTTAPIIGNDVKEEHEANEFSHYLLNQNFTFKLIGLIWKCPKIFIGIALILTLSITAIVVFVSVKKEQSFYGNYYITPTGVKYHQLECIHVKYHKKVERLTKEQFATGEYGPCGTCLPE